MPNILDCELSHTWANSPTVSDHGRPVGMLQPRKVTADGVTHTMVTLRESSGPGVVNNEWLRLASDRSVVRRACRYAVCVGALLITINHGDAILRGDISIARLLRMALTAIVPYAVSTASSVSALRERRALARNEPAGS